MSSIKGGKRGIPFSGVHWTAKLKDNIKKTNFKGSWNDAVLYRINIFIP